MVRLTAKLKSALKTIKKRKAQKHAITPMPRLLMHWWTPLILAIILLAASCFIASVWDSPLSTNTLSTIDILKPSTWPFVYHWPSAEAMKLCVTITGAGLAFAAWQQKHHDNVFNTTQAKIVAEREEYWKRREQVFQLLGSKNPALRLGAISLLTELADKAKQTFPQDENASNLEDLHQHIIDTLCLQVRREGMSNNEDGSEHDRRKIQHTIIEAILVRINTRMRNGNYADWSQHTISLTHCNILTPINIVNMATQATLILEGTTFTKLFRIADSNLGPIFWTTSTFEDQILVGSSKKLVTIQTETIPFSKGGTAFINTTLNTSHKYVTIDLQRRKNNGKDESAFLIRNCTFYCKECTCNPYCPCKTKSSSCSCIINDQCTCESNCTYAELDVIETIKDRAYKPTTSPIEISNCRMRQLFARLSNNSTNITIHLNTILEGLRIVYPQAGQTSSILAKSESKHSTIRILNNIFTTPSKCAPIEIYYETNEATTSTYEFATNLLLPTHMYQQSKYQFAGYYFGNLTFGNFTQIQTIEATELTDQSDHFHFDCFPHHSNEPSIQSWDTGRLSTSSSTIPFQLLERALSCHHEGNFEHFQIEPATKRDYQFIKREIEYYNAKEETASDTAYWIRDYANFDAISSDLNSGNCYSASDRNGPIALFSLIQGPHKLYENKGIAWHLDTDYYYIQHVVAIRGKGIASKIFEFATQHAHHLRTHTHEGNFAMRHALEAFGFKKCGAFKDEDGATCIAYDWIKDLASTDNTHPLINRIHYSTVIMPNPMPNL